MPREEKASSIAAFFSALCFPGLGYLYLGKPLQALFASIFTFLALFAFSVSIQKWLFGFWFSLGFMMVWSMCLIIATLVHLKKHGKHSYAWFYSGPFTITLGLILSFAIEPAFLHIYSMVARYRPFSIPGTSMEPFIRKGDRLVVDTSWYKHNSFKVGDLVAYEAPDDSRVLYIKRVVALGGDSVEMREGHLMRNGKQEMAANYSPIPSGPIHYQADTYHQYSMLPMTVPIGYVFCLGDNRGNSLDSRIHGPVSIENVQGKAIYTWWPLRNIKSNYD